MVTFKGPKGFLHELWVGQAQWYMRLTQEFETISEFEASLLYLSNSRSVRATQSQTMPQTNQKPEPNKRYT